MGYTHYWYKKSKLSLGDWNNFQEDFEILLHGLKDNLAFSGDQSFEFSTNVLYFNGIGENGHETFMFERQESEKKFVQKDDDGFIFSFCKTARKPYDSAVCCALIIAKKYFGDSIKVSSDGDDEDGWLEAKQNCQYALGYGIDFDINSGDFQKVVLN